MLFSKAHLSHGSHGVDRVNDADSVEGCEEALQRLQQVYEAEHPDIKKLEQVVGSLPELEAIRGCQRCACLVNNSKWQNGFPDWGDLKVVPVVKCTSCNKAQ